MAQTPLSRSSGECSFCGKEFGSQLKLERHTLIHTGEKPFDCVYCGRKFNQSSSLKNHLRTHTGERPFNCGFCERTFAKAANRNDHVRTHTGERPYHCKKCPKSFATWAAVSRHEKEHSSCYTCQYCKRRFRRNDNLKAHISNIHKRKREEPETCLWEEHTDGVIDLTLSDNEEEDFTASCVKRDVVEARIDNSLDLDLTTSEYEDEM